VYININFIYLFFFMPWSYESDIAELKTDIKYISRTLAKVEIVLEKQLATEEKLSVANKRILKNEEAIQASYLKNEEIVKSTHQKFELALKTHYTECKLALKTHDEKFTKIDNLKSKIIGWSIVISTVLWFVLNKMF